MKTWQEFFEQFNIGNGTFIHTLTDEYPGLTSMEFKLCCLLRAGYTNPQIAEMTYNTKRAVETARYRLRKKLAITSKENLSLFLMRL